MSRPTKEITTERQAILLERLRRQRRFVYPKDVGGTKGSYHARTLKQLVKKGLVQKIIGGRYKWISIL